MADLPRFVPGLDLAAAFFQEIVEPLLNESAPGLVYSAGLIGPGSEVLGYDTARSTDHHWGPRVMIFVRLEDLEGTKPLVEYLAHRLPPTFRGWSTNWGAPDQIGVRLLEPAAGEINHRVEFSDVDGYLTGYLGRDPRGDWPDAVWREADEHKLLALRSGRVFRDDLGLKGVLERFSFYPRPVWLNRMADLWDLIGREQPFIGRCLETGDEIGSRVVVNQLTEAAIRLAFLQKRTYAPYHKWLGTAFARLGGAGVLVPLVETVLAAGGERREASFQALVEELARRHNGLGLTERLPEKSVPFHDRPFLVIQGELFAAALRQLP